MLAGRGVAVFATGLAMWVAARLLGSPGLEVVAIGIAALPLLAAWATKRSARRISCVGSSEVRVTPGTACRSRSSLENASPIPTSFLLLEDRLPTPLSRAARLVMGASTPARERAAYAGPAGPRALHGSGRSSWTCPIPP